MWRPRRGLKWMVVGTPFLSVTTLGENANDCPLAVTLTSLASAGAVDRGEAGQDDSDEGEGFQDEAFR